MRYFSESTGRLRAWLRVYTEGCDNPDFRHYLGSLDHVTSLRRIWLMQHLIELGKMRRARVLDVGCGFGWDAVSISLLGESRVVATDIRESMTRVVSERVALLRSLGAPVFVETLTGDICSLSLSSRSFDAIVCNQTIEHVHDLERMFEVCREILKPGGRLVITNDNNALNRAQLEETAEMWHRRDTSWEYIEQLKRERPIENRDIKPYGVMREEIIRRANPRLPEVDVQLLVRSTAGMIEPDIARLAGDYSQEKPLPVPPPLSWCRNPVTGEYCERQLIPDDIVNLATSRGLIARLRHGFRRFPLRLLNEVHFRALSHQLFQLRPFFIIVAERPPTLDRGPVKKARRSSKEVKVTSALTERLSLVD